ncbi:YcaO-like family protein [Streptomyces sp. NPDC008001]|uniref:YcaO-like family protein n=1 Tax=Streptomyces sp. NPDC008001 TaxID=3364804 RepID=UPI0036E9801B
MSTDVRTTLRRWQPQVFTPFARSPDDKNPDDKNPDGKSREGKSPDPESPVVVFARTAARSAEFAPAAAPDGAKAVIVGSAAGDDPADVAARARGELLERMGNILAGRQAERARHRIGTHDDWRRRGVPALDPAALSGDPAARTLRGLWVTARSLRTGEELLVPAGAAYLRHRPPAGCAPLARAGSTGLGAHPDPRQAAGHAAREILERDLIRRSWYGPDAPRPVLIPADSDLLPVAVRKVLEARGERATVLSLASPAGPVCTVVCVHRRDDGSAQSFGARCTPARLQASAVAGAAYEALMVRWSMTGPEAVRTWAGRKGRTPPRTALEHALWTFHRQDSLAHWLNRPHDRPPGTGLPPPADPEDGVAALAAHTGEDVLLVETDAPQLAEEHVSVVRLIAPGAAALPTGDGGIPGALPHPFG